MQYHPNDIEKKWQDHWAKNSTFKAQNNSSKPKYYVLDMFPYPSGAGLHVGHPLGYIASDVVSRFKRLKGFNVLHPMGYDSFGLPAEQYAIQTGQHPAITTRRNIDTFRRQMDNIGFSFDWDREVRTSDSSYYKWTQWIFLQLFNAWYDKDSNKARPIAELVAEFAKNGNNDVNAHCDETPVFSADEWNSWKEAKQQTVLLNYRIAYLSEAYVNWCPQLGTVLANDEVKDGVSERGGHPVERKLMKQWSMRISAYSQRLLDGLDGLDWNESLKEQQRNWIGRSEGAMIRFQVSGFRSQVEVFTTRPDTIFGVTFMTLAPEHELVAQITTAEQKAEVAAYIEKAKSRSDRERMADVKTISGAFTGAYAEHPFTGTPIPIWIGDYVLAGYGTGAVMAVPSGDQRDFNFAKHFDLPIPQVLSSPTGEEGSGKVFEANESKEATLINSEFLNGLKVKDAIRSAIEKLEEKGHGKGMVNYRQRDAVFGRQRYWGEPIPIYFKDGVPYPINKLPLELPEVEKYLPTRTGEPPLGNAENWNWNPKTEQVVPNGEGYPIELSTMPGWAGSSWYYLRYMDPKNDKEFCSKEAIAYWKNVDHYAGGSEHATGHLLYVRFWTKFLKDLGHIPFDEPAKKLVNQGMIQGRSSIMYRQLITMDRPLTSRNIETLNLPKVAWYLSKSVYERYHYGEQTEADKSIFNKILSGLTDECKMRQPNRVGDVNYAMRNETRVDVSLVRNDELDIEAFRNSRAEYKNAVFILEDAAGNPVIDHPVSSGHPSFSGGEQRSDRLSNADSETEAGSPPAKGEYRKAGRGSFSDEIQSPRSEGVMNLSELKTFRKELRKNLTPAEARLWTLIKEKKLDGRKFRRQHSVSGYILDFYCPSEHLAIELDGDGHFQANVTEYDNERTQFIEQFGIKVIRFENKLVFDQIENVLEEIKRNFGWEKDHPVPSGHPSFSGGEQRSDRLSNADPETEAGSPPAKGEYREAGRGSFSAKGELPLSKGVYICGWEIEKMSKSKYNVVNPDDIIERYGADTLRLYEMFLGPLEDAKPWNTNGIEGVHRFLKKFWRLFHNANGFRITEEEPTPEELKSLHATIKKVEEDIERLSLNTSVSQFMICVNELTELKCDKRAVLEPLTIVLSTYAPHICEELWEKLGHAESITFADYPAFSDTYLVEDRTTYPISFNGKMRFNLELPASMGKEEVEKSVLANEEVLKRLDGATPKKVIVVLKRIVNIVV